MDHTMAECHVIQKQIDNMRAQWDAQPHDANAHKQQKINNKRPKQGGDLHVLVDSYNKAKNRLEKELKQQQMACGKHKHEACLDTAESEKREKAKEKEGSDFHAELEQLMLTDVSDDEELDELVLDVAHRLLCNWDGERRDVPLRASRLHQNSSFSK
jgi:hypothetical protein